MAESEFKVPNFLANRATCQKFCGLYEECLSTLSESFPECTRTRAELQRYTEHVKGHESEEEKLIQQWHKDMVPSYERTDRHDDAVWTSLPLFRDIDMEPKLRDPGFGPESVQVLWEYVDGLSRHARIYNAIPDKMLNHIQATAMTYASKVKSGEIKFDLDNLNWDEVKTMGQSLVESVDPKDIEEFTQNLAGLATNLKISSMQDIFKLVGELPGLGEAVSTSNAPLAGLLEQVMSNPQVGELLQSGDTLLGELAQRQK